MCETLIIQGYLCLASNFVIVDTADAEELWIEGCYGLSPTRDGRKKAVFGTLSLQEALYLMEIGRLKIDDVVDTSDFMRKLISHYKESFLASSIVYCRARRLGWIVQSGLNFGSDYLLYRGRPGSEHAPIALCVHYQSKNIDQSFENLTKNPEPPGDFCEKLLGNLHINDDDFKIESESTPISTKEPHKPESLSWRKILALNRVCASARKRLVVAYVTGPLISDDTKVRFLSVSRWCPESDRT